MIIVEIEMFIGRTLRALAGIPGDGLGFRRGFRVWV